MKNEGNNIVDLNEVDLLDLDEVDWIDRLEHFHGESREWDNESVLAPEISR